EYKSFNRETQLISFIDSTINKLVNKEGVAKDKITVLSNRKKSNSVLKEVDKVGGCLIDEVDDNEDVIKFRTIQGFKGLESDVIIFINHTFKDDPKTDDKNSLKYTALTRARFFLYCIDYYDKSKSN
ncbi:MAG: ATP-binding domain-containing protein, partial [Bacilli bacterium]|nr:ATP-binding domain-containing protein [Bacilli bacterium]